MPGRGLHRDEFDPTKSDSDDETYGASHALHASHSRKKVPKLKKRRRRPSRRALDSRDDDDEIEESEDEEDDDESIVSEEEDSVEFGSNGRPLRRAAKNHRPIVDEDSDQIESLTDSDPLSCSVVLRYDPAKATSLEPVRKRESSRPSTRLTRAAVTLQEPQTNRQDQIVGRDERESSQNGPVIAESFYEAAEGSNEDEDVLAQTRTRRLRFAGNDRSVLGKRKTRSSQKVEEEGSSDFEPVAEEAPDEDMSESPSPSKPAPSDEDDQPFNAPRRTRNRVETDDEQEELLEELDELQSRRPLRSRKMGIIMQSANRNKRRRVNKVNYDIMANSAAIARAIEEAEDGGHTSQDNSPSKGRVGGQYGRTLFSTYGPFGGGGAAPLLGDPNGMSALAGADSDSSDDDNMALLPPGVQGMTPAAAVSTGPANLGKQKDKQSLADADPLGVDPNVNFDGVGGLGNHINQLKEMVVLPLLYPEIFLRFHLVPPRGVLFHGPPGTGKTLLARALASSMSSQGRKVTFYMRKGADALSKWVGEAERQLRLLFEEARKTQPSIIFFDEIDGLAPVRSSKQEQIHSSIVSTLLALMDGMDGRGQVIVIGATNRPDSIDPALRRPGRFDREFYFPLPNTQARRSILDIHTKHWQPSLTDRFKDEIAAITKGYGGADLRALCTEAALNAVQRSYPQIYSSDQKLLIDPESIRITAKDFLISIAQMVPSSERSTTSGASPLPDHVRPLLNGNLQMLQRMVAEILPYNAPRTALQEAEYEESMVDDGMQAEKFRQEFEKSRVFRPRLLVQGAPGMGQQYLIGALLNHLESIHVQTLDLPALFSDSSRSSETVLVQAFAEARRRKPSIIYIPAIDLWTNTIPSTLLSIFHSLLDSLTPQEPIMLLGLQSDSVEPFLDLFGKTRYEIRRPLPVERSEFFRSVIEHISLRPDRLPMAQTRRKRVHRELPLAPTEMPKPTTPISQKDLKAQKRKDRLSLNYLKMHIQPIMSEIKKRYRKFRLGVIDEKDLRYLFDDIQTSELPADEARPFEKAVDKNGEPGLRSVASGKFFYNLDITIIERRLANGYYKRARDFLSDIKKITKDAKASGDEERILRATELQNNVEVDMHNFEVSNPVLAVELEAVYEREQQREKELRRKHEAAQAKETMDSERPAVTAEETQAPPTLPEPAIEGPDLSMFGVDSNSQLADTVGNTQPSSSSVPSRTHEISPSGPTSAPAYFRNDEPSNEVFLQECVQRTAQCSVEELEQLYSQMMTVLWDTQSNWDRVEVRVAVQRVFTQTLESFERSLE